MIELFIENKLSKKGVDYVYLYALTDYGRKIPLTFDMSAIVELLDIAPSKLMSLGVDCPVLVGSIDSNNVSK